MCLSTKYQKNNISTQILLEPDRDVTEPDSDTKLVSTGYTVENETMTTENTTFSNTALGDVKGQTAK